MLTELCMELRNYFCSPEDIQAGTFTVEDGSIEPLSFLQDGQYFRIVGSVFNDGVWQYGATTDLVDETFDGFIWPMKVPKAVVDLSAEIAEWLSTYKDLIGSPYQSESFGGYSYVKAVAGTGKTEQSWQSHFASKLKNWRKVSVL